MKSVTAPRNLKIKGQDHMLAYITAKEAALLKARGGSGRMTEHGVRAYNEGPGGDPSDNANSMSESATQDAVGGNMGQGAGPTGAGAGSGPPGDPDPSSNEDAGNVEATAQQVGPLSFSAPFGVFDASRGMGVIGGLASLGLGAPGLGVGLSAIGAAIDAQKAQDRLDQMGIQANISTPQAVANAASIGALGQSAVNQFGNALGFDAFAEAPMSATFGAPDPLGDIAASQMDSGGADQGLLDAVPPVELPSAVGSLQKPRYQIVNNTLVPVPSGLLG